MEKKILDFKVKVSEGVAELREALTDGPVAGANVGTRLADGHTATSFRVASRPSSDEGEPMPEPSQKVFKGWYIHSAEGLRKYQGPLCLLYTSDAADE